MNTRSITENCWRNFNQRNHVCFGMSPFNSYFSEAKILQLAEWGKKGFKSMHFFIPDVPSAYTLEALGYDPEKASWKARRQSQYLFNKTQKALISLGYSLPQAQDMILNWEKLSQNPRYLGALEKVKQLYEEDMIFRKACLEASKWVLEKRVLDASNITEKMLQSAVRYLLAEIPLFADAGGIVGEAASVFCYHQCIEFIEELMKGDFRFSASESQGFVVIEEKFIHY